MRPQIKQYTISNEGVGGKKPTGISYTFLLHLYKYLIIELLKLRPQEHSASMLMICYRWAREGVIGFQGPMHALDNLTVVDATSSVHQFLSSF